LGIGNERSVILYINVEVQKIFKNLKTSSTAKGFDLRGGGERERERDAAGCERQREGAGGHKR
jgi:hypothetical protein